jgi:hypothetical protein
LGLAAQSPRHQFSLSTALVWISYLAALCGAWNWLLSYGWSAHGLYERLQISSLLPPAKIAGLTILMTLVLLSGWPAYLTLPGLLLAPIAISYVDANYLTAWIRGDIGMGYSWSAYLATYLWFGLIVAIHLLWCRHRGYRLEWRPRENASETQA